MFTNNNNLIEIDYNFISSKPFILTICILFLLCFICFVICSFCVLRFLQISFEYNNIFFYQYNKKCQKIIDEYGDCKINKIYIVRQPFGKSVNLVFNILSLFNYNKYLTEAHENYPYHPALIFEIKYNNNIKFLLVEKNNCINICETFLMHKTYEFKQINIPKNKFTLRKILTKTQRRVGNHKYFNWNIYKNNCQEFTKEILLTLNKNLTAYDKFIFSDKIMKKYYLPSDFTLHIINCLFIIINFIEKYLLDNNIFY
jgi:hypothetical protein